MKKHAYLEISLKDVQVLMVIYTKPPLSDLKLARVIESSIDRYDNLHESLSKKTQAQSRYHYNCYITYVDQKKIAFVKESM